MLTTAITTLAITSISSLAALPAAAKTAALVTLAFGIGGVAFIRYLEKADQTTVPMPLNTTGHRPVYKRAA